MQSLKLPGDVLLAMIRRQNENLVPHGQTIIKQGDVVIAIAPAVTEPAQLELTEMLIEEGHSWQGRRIKDLKLPPALLIMMILRDETLMVPDGNTQIAAEDVLIIHQPSNTKKRIK